jgi:predicted CopG family antitoxin
METKVIKISKELWEYLKSQKIIERESFDDVLWRFVKLSSKKEIQNG